MEPLTNTFLYILGFILLVAHIVMLFNIASIKSFSRDILNELKKSNNSDLTAIERKAKAYDEKIGL
jgi:hypothetical protein